MTGGKLVELTRAEERGHLRRIAPGRRLLASVSVGGLIGDQELNGEGTTELVSELDV